MWKSDFMKPETTSEDEDWMDSEVVMKQIHKLYQTREIGLNDAAKGIADGSVRVTMPQQKITVLIVGHHHAAKQKFLDLYFNESRQGAFISKVDYDKLDRIFITHGNQRRWLSGESVLEYCPNLAKLKNVSGIKDYLTTEIATRKTKSLVSFVLAPEAHPDEQEKIGEIDENSNPRRKRPLDVDKAVSTLAEAADLIFIFFDPTGRVVPKFTLLPFDKLWDNHQEKFHLLLAKASPEECSEETRENTLASIVREIWRNPVVRKTGYIPQIYCPDLTSEIRDDERLWHVIQDSMEKSVWRALTQLKDDATNLKEHLNWELARNNYAKERGHAPLFNHTMIGIMLLFISVWMTQLGDILTYDIKQKEFVMILMELWKKPAMVCTIILLIIYCFIRAAMLFEQRSILTPEEEDLLNRRIQFANHALFERERMEKLYYGGVAKDHHTDADDVSENE